MKETLTILLLVASGLMVACDRSPSPNPTRQKSAAPDVLATVEGHEIRLADFEQKLKSRVAGNGSTPWPVEREAMLQELVKLEAIYVRAKAAGFDRQPEIARQVKALIVDRFLEQQLKSEGEAPAVGEEQIEEYYRTHRERFATKEQVRFAVIQFGFSPKATEEKKGDVLRKAESVLNEARAQAERTFGSLAQRYSEDQATRYVGGDAGWLSRGEDSRWAPEVIDAAFALKNPGELSPVVQSLNGCYLVRLLERKEAGHRPLEAVAEAIRYQLAIQKRHRAQEAIHETMMSGLQIEINHALLNGVSAPPLPSVPTFALPGS